MKWFGSIILALIIIFTVPIINNIDGVGYIFDDIKNYILKGLSDLELTQLLGDSFFYDDEEFDNPGSVEDQQQAALKREYAKRYNQSVSPQRMLLLATEVYTSHIRKITYYSMPVHKNFVEGWTVVARYPESATGKEVTTNGTSAVLWVNNLDKTTYCFAIAGTDQFSDMLEYIPMEIFNTRSKQQKEVHSIVSNLDYEIEKNKTRLKLGDIEKFYITGHSLGGFLSMSLGTDIIDSAVAQANNTTTDSFTKVSDISETLDVNNVYTYTFAAPGLVNEIPAKLIEIINSSVDLINQIKYKPIYDFLTGLSTNGIPNWSKEKFENNKNGVYNNNVFQYTNSRDVVPNIKNWFGWLLKEGGVIDLDNWFMHLGSEYETTSNRLSNSEKWAFLNRFNIFKDGVTTLLNDAALLLDLHYHLPWTYYEQIKSNNFKLI